MNLVKLLLIGLGLLLLAAGVYFLVIRESEQTVFEQIPDTEEAHPGLAPPQTTLPTDKTSLPTPLEIMPEDCTKECAPFPVNSDPYIYCRSVCGLPLSSPDTSTETKATDPALSKAIQQKDEAIKNRDLSQCNEITDANLRKACQVRVTEDLLE